jgi:hypothetical protein
MAERSQKSIVFEVLEEAVEAERSGSGRLDGRGLFYAIRRLYLNHPDRPFALEARLAQVKKHPEHVLEMGNVDKILVAYQQEHGKIEDLEREARGHYYPAHDEDGSAEIGTEFADGFEPPEYFFDKALYVEKHGIALGLIDEGLGERYDMAIVASKGYATEADRRLLLRLAEEGYQVIVFHDCDVDGFGILANLRTGNQRIGAVAGEVIDLGLGLEDIRSFDPPLIGEEATRSKAIPDATIAQLTEDELRMLWGTQTRWKDPDKPRSKDQWTYLRYELNEIPSDQRVPFVERALAAAGVRPKVIPPARYLADEAAEMVENDVRTEVQMAVRELVGTEAIVDALLPILRERYGTVDPAVLARYIRFAFRERPLCSWRDVLHSHASGRGTSLRPEIVEAVKTEILKNLGVEEEE